MSAPAPSAVASAPGDGTLQLTCPSGMTQPLAALAFAHGWELVGEESSSDVRLRPVRP